MLTTLHRLVFSSQIQIELSDAELVALLRKARDYNQRHRITGLLLYHAGQMLGVLEGPAAEVRLLYTRIRADARHRDVLLLSDGPARARIFADWRMGFAAGCPAEFRQPPAGYFNPQRQPLPCHPCPDASPQLLNLLREFGAARPGEPV